MGLVYNPSQLVAKMLPEVKERKLPERTVIEFCGTPFAAKDKFLVSNAIEDMISERIGERIGEAQGITSFAWLSSIGKNSRLEYFEETQRVKGLLTHRSVQEGVFLIQDSAFAAMVATEVSKKAHIITEQEADQLTNGLLPYIRMEDLIMITLVNPRAALVRESYPRDLDGYDRIVRQKFIFYSIFNEEAENLLRKYEKELPRFEIIAPKGDEFQAEQIFFQNADTVFNFLGLPSIAEWTKHLKSGQGKSDLQFGRVAGRTMAGLTEEEIRESIRSWDWSQQPDKRAKVSRTIHQIISALEEQGIIPSEE